MAWASTQDLFDQSTSFGRLALVHVLMMAGDTMVTVSLAGSLFFSVSPTEAKGRVLLYLLITVAPFAVVSPVLGPLIDRSSNGRRILVALSAGARALLCWSMAQHLNSLWLYPEAFLVLISSKLYVVTRGTLVPEMARSEQLRVTPGRVGGAGWPENDRPQPGGFAGFNAQLTLLGTLAGLLAGSLGAGILKSLGATSVLIVAAVVYVASTVASARLPRPERVAHAGTLRMSQDEADVHALRPLGESEVAWGLVAATLERFSVGFATFLLAFGLRRLHAGLGWFGAALVLSALGALGGLGLVARVRERLRESTLLALSLLGTGLGAALASLNANLVVQSLFAGWIGLWAAVAQPSFDAITQRLVAPGAQGRTFARFAVRQQLGWVIGALVPVGISLSFSAGDHLLAVVTLLGSVLYALRRR